MAKAEKKPKSRERSGRPTMFPGKEIARSWRVQRKTFEQIKDAGDRIVNPEWKEREGGGAVGAADVLEALAELYADKLTFNDIKRAAAARARRG